jgi:hypothetical protein
MKAKRFAGIMVGLGLVCLIVVWLVRPAPQSRRSGLSVTFAGLTNGASGAMVAQFNLANAFSQRVSFGIGEVQVRQRNGWPNSMRVAGGSNWIAVAAGYKVGFSVSAPSPEAVTWRVPLIYKVEFPLIDEMRFRIKVIAYEVANWRPGRPLPVVHGDGQPTSIITGPEMVGLSDSERGAMDYGP